MHAKQSLLMCDSDEVFVCEHNPLPWLYPIIIPIYRYFTWWCTFIRKQVAQNISWSFISHYDTQHSLKVPPAKAYGRFLSSGGDDYGLHEPSSMERPEGSPSWRQLETAVAVFEWWKSSGETVVAQGVRAGRLCCQRRHWTEIQIWGCVSDTQWLCFRPELSSIERHNYDLFYHNISGRGVCLSLIEVIQANRGEEGFS